MNIKIWTPVEIALHLGTFVSQKYEYEKWNQTTTESVAKVVCAITNECLTQQIADIDCYEANVVLTMYRVFGLLPSRNNNHGQWLLWKCACKYGDDDLALGMLMDGFDYKLCVPGFHSALNYVQKNRHNLPKTWSYFCQEDLTKKAAKVRKRSWASNTYTERAM